MGIVNARIKKLAKNFCNDAIEYAFWPATTAKRIEINHVHWNLGVETLVQLLPDVFGTGDSRPTGKKRGSLRRFSASQLDER
jgi:hypothetical protein